MGIVEWGMGLLRRRPAIKEEQPEPLSERLVKSDQPFPWALLSEDEKAAVVREIRGTLSVTSGGVCLSPWQCGTALSEERVAELAKEASGIVRASSGLAELDSRLWKP